jgi:type IV pilus assembly protein PilW
MSERAMKTKGFTLIELLVALAVGIILLGGLVQIFIMTKNNLRVQQGLNYMQENLRFAVSEVTYSTRMSGFFHIIGQPRTQPVGASGPFDSVTGTGTVQTKSTITVLASAPPAPPCGVSSWTVGIQGFDAQDIPPCIPPGNYLAGTDAFAVTYLQPAFLGLPQIITPGSLTPSGSTEIQPPTPAPELNGLYVLVLDASDPGDIYATQGGLLARGVELLPYLDAALFHAPGSEATQTNGSAPFNRIKRSAALMPLQFELYYVRACAVLSAGGACAATSDGGNPQPTLVKRRLLESGAFIDEPVVSGIEQMQLEYLGSGCGGYLNARGINSQAGCTVAGVLTAEQRWQRVLSVRVALLARSLEGSNDPSGGTYDLSADTPTYNPALAAQLPRNVRYARRVMVTLASTRNAVRPLPTL